MDGNYIIFEDYNNLANVITQSLDNEIDPNKGFYTLVVDADNRFDTETRYIPLDFVSSLSVQSNSDVTSYPLLTGDILTDHKYDKPKVINISGKFSLNGSNTDNFFVGEKTDRLKNIESYFERVQQLGLTLSLICITNDGKPRFKVRNNLVLTSINFRYNLNNIEFTFGLQECFFFDSSSLQAVEYTGDPDLPTYGEFTTLSFSEDVLGAENITSSVCQILWDNGLLAKEFITDYLANLTGLSAVPSMLVSGVVVFAVGMGLLTAHALTAMALKGVALTATLASGIPVVGWIALGVVAIVGIVTLVKKWIQYTERAKMIAEFRSYDEKSLMLQECQRFNDFITSIQNAFDEFVGNNNIKYYSLTSNEKKQEVYISIDGVILRFNFEQDANNYWNLSVTKIGLNDEEVSLTGGSKLIGTRELINLRPNDKLFNINNYNVYCLNKAYAFLELNDDALANMLKDEWEKKSLTYLGYTTEEMESEFDKTKVLNDFKNGGIYKDISQFVFVVTDTDTSTMKNNLESIIKEKLYK